MPMVVMNSDDSCDNGADGGAGGGDSNCDEVARHRDRKHGGEDDDRIDNCGNDTDSCND